MQEPEVTCTICGDVVDMDIHPFSAAPFGVCKEPGSQSCYRIAMAKQTDAHRKEVALLNKNHDTTLAAFKAFSEELSPVVEKNIQLRAQLDGVLAAVDAEPDHAQGHKPVEIAKASIKERIVALGRKE